jgi:hypothetical protein
MVAVPAASATGKAKPDQFDALAAFLGLMVRSRYFKPTPKSAASCAASRTRKSGLPDLRILMPISGKPEIGGRPSFETGATRRLCFSEAHVLAPSSG